MMVAHRAPGSPLGRGTGDCAQYGAFSSGQQPRRACHDIKAGLHPPPRAMREEGVNEDHDQDESEPEWAFTTLPCLLCQKGRESSAYPGTCDKCGIAYPLGDGDEAKVLQWLQQPARQMRCPDCGEQSIAKMPGGQYQCYRCVSRKTEEHQSPRGKMLGDFLTSESCGSVRVAFTTQRAMCLACDSALRSTLAKMAMAQLKLWKSSHRSELEGPQVKVFSMQELAAKIEALDAGDDDSKGRIKSTIQKLADGGEARALSVPQAGWFELLRVFGDMHPNFSEVLETNVLPSLAIAAAGGRVRPAPALLLGAPGVGKSYFADSLARYLGIASLKVDMAAQIHGAALVGSSAFWSNSAPGELFKLLAFGSPGQRPSADPLVFLDELDKVNSDSLRYDPMAGLYSLLEVESARRFEDQSMTGIGLDASHVRWLLAGNSARNLPAPILSRVHVFEIPELTTAQKHHLFARIFEMLVNGTGLDGFESQLPEAILKPVQGLGMRQFKTLAGVAIGRALQDGRWKVELDDFRRPGVEVTKLPMGFGSSGAR